MIHNPDHQRLIALLNAEKRAVNLSVWARKSNGKSLEIRSPLEIDGIIEAGVDLFITCQSDLPGERVTVGMNVETKDKPKCFARIDWRGPPHGNAHFLCGAQQFNCVGPTHFHDPRRHDPAVDCMDYLLANLPLALDLPAEPKDFMDLMGVCAKLLNTTNLEDTPIPPWQAKATLI